jgi:hypothetical protein
LNTDGKLSNNQEIISNSLNDNLLSAVDRINNKILNNLPSDSNTSTSTDYLLQTFKDPFPNINYKYTSKKEIENIIKSLKSSISHGCDEISTKVLKSQLVFQ